MILEVYIEKAFLFELQERADKTHELVSDFIAFLQQLRDVRLTMDMNHEELTELAERCEYFVWLLEVAPLIFDVNWATDLHARCKGGAVSKLFLLSESHQHTDSLEQQYGYLFINNRNLKDKWTFVKRVQDEDFFSANEHPEIPYWERLNGMRHPFNSVLLFDKYILSDKSNQKIAYNLQPLLDCLLCRCCSSRNKKDVVIISEKILDNEHALTTTQKIKKVYDLLQGELSRCANFEVFIYDEKKVSGNTKEHDRILMTNYLYFEAGAGFSVYDKHVHAHSHLKVSVRSIFKNSHRKVIKECLQNLSVYTAKLKDNNEVVEPGKAAGEKPRVVSTLSFYPSKLNRLVNIYS